MQLMGLTAGAAGVAGYVASKKYGGVIPGGNVGKVVAGGAVLLGASWLGPKDGGASYASAAVAAFGAGVLLDGALGFVGL